MGYAILNRMEKVHCADISDLRPVGGGGLRLKVKPRSHSDMYIFKIKNTVKHLIFVRTFCTLVI